MPQTSPSPSLGRALEDLASALAKELESLGTGTTATSILLVVVLGVWCLFWLLAVDWTRLRHLIVRGGWAPLLLMAVVTVLTWEMIDPLPDGGRRLLGLTITAGYLDKFVYVTGLLVAMFLCGTMQLAGCCGIGEAAAEEVADEAT